MKTLLPNDFFLNEDAPASIEHANGLMSVKLQNNGDCFINAVIIPSSGWTGNTVRIRLRMRSSTGASSDHALMNAKLFSWPSENSSVGPVGGVNNQLDVPLFSVNPSIIVSGDVVLEVPEGYSPDMAITMNLSMDTSASTAGLEPRIVAVEYQFE